jgi:hypothetical protein
VDAAAEFAGGDDLAVHIKALAAGVDGGDEVMPVTVIEFCSQASHRL